MSSKKNIAIFYLKSFKINPFKMLLSGIFLHRDIFSNTLNLTETANNGSTRCR